MNVVALRRQLLVHYPGIKLDLVQCFPDVVALDRLVVPAERRGAGLGTMVMNDIIEWADMHELTIALTPSPDFGGNKARLAKWYRSMGFVMTKGRKMDFRISYAMYREPGR